MKIMTKDFGLLEIDEGEIIRFPKGVFAFQNAKKFILITKDDCPAIWLQCVTEQDPRFMVFEPEQVVEGYSPAFPDEVYKTLQAEPGEALYVLVIAVIPENLRDTTVNLKSPIVINQKKRLAVQVILDNDAYPIRYRIFD